MTFRGHNVLRALLSALLLLPLAACEPEEQGGNGSLGISLRNSSLDAPAGSTWVTVNASGSWTITVSFDGGEWAVVDPSSGSGSRADVRFRYEANESSEPRTAVLTIRSGKLSAVAQVTQYGAENKPSGGGSSAGGGADVAPFRWLELPATAAGDGLTFYSRDMDGRKYVSESRNGVRNWSNYWDAEEHMSLWVAYPLNRKLIGTGSRSNAWGFDPQMPISAQPDLTQGSYGGGWTRGHQIPSADRLSWSANVTTFYGTNMTPQEYDFNAGIWASLEGKVRSYADRADTLYVVTGCLYSDSNLFTGVSSGFPVRVPSHYFKALLFRGVSTYATDGFMAAGFLLPHDPSIARGNCLDYIMSVDELENLTGIDFFPNLADVLGPDKAGAIEAKTPSNWWK